MSSWRRIFFLVAVVAFVGSALVDSARAETGTARVSVRDLQFFVQQIPPVQSNEASFTAEYDKRFDVSKKLSLQFHPYAYGSSLEETREHQVQFDPRGMYLDYEAKVGWLKAGYLTMKWEGTDGLNPMDIASMKDWSDPLLTESRASAAVAVGRSGESYDFEFAYIPQQTMWLLPGVKSPWLPRRFAFPLRTSAFELRLPSRVDYRYAPRVDLNDPASNNIATRLQLRGELGDIALAYYDGLADSPALEPVLDVAPISGQPINVFQLLSPAQITPIAYRVRTVAGFASRAFGAWIVRGSTRYDQPFGPNDNRMPEWSQYSVVGVERSFDLMENTVTVLLEGAFVRAPESNSLFSIRDVFNHAVLFGLRSPIGDKITTMISGFRSTRDTSYYVKAEIGYRWSDHWRTDITTELLDGPSNSLLGVFGENKRAFVTLGIVY